MGKVFYGIPHMISRILNSPIDETALILLPFPIYSLLLGMVLLQIAAPSSPMFVTSIFMNLELNFGQHVQLVCLFILEFLDFLYFYFMVGCIHYGVYFQLLFMIWIRKEIQARTSPKSR